MTVDTEQFRRLEEDLWRNEPGERDRILDDDFREFCRFGAVYDRAHLLTETPVGVSVTYPFDDFRAEQLAENVVLVTYQNTVTNNGATQRARRSSIWVRHDAVWRLHFQQATTLPD
jgi:hypothetical protein